MEEFILMMTEIIKIDDTTVAKVGTQEVRQIFGSTQLTDRKARLEEQLAEVNALLDALKQKYILNYTYIYIVVTLSSGMKPIDELTKKQEDYLLELWREENE